MGPVSWLATNELTACAFPPNGSGSLQALNVAHSCGAAADFHRTSRYPKKRIVEFLQDHEVVWPSTSTDSSELCSAHRAGAIGLYYRFFPIPSCRSDRFDAAQTSPRPSPSLACFGSSKSMRMQLPR